MCGSQACCFLYAPYGSEADLHERQFLADPGDKESLLLCCSTLATASCSRVVLTDPL
jgi:hypothetical protein